MTSLEGIKKGTQPLWLSARNQIQLSTFSNTLENINCVNTRSTWIAISFEITCVPSSTFPSCPWYDRLAEVIKVSF